MGTIFQTYDFSIVDLIQALEFVEKYCQFRISLIQIYITKRSTDRYRLRDIFFSEDLFRQQSSSSYQIENVHYRPSFNTLILSYSVLEDNTVLECVHSTLTTDLPGVRAVSHATDMLLNIHTYIHIPI